jgi:hypothetical protein
MLDEKSGAVAYDLVSGRVAGAQNGAHTGVTLGADGIGDGRACPFYDGANDLTNVYTATFAAAFNAAEGTAMMWAKVVNAGVWTDGAARRSIQMRADISNRISIEKAAANNEINFVYIAGGTSEVVAIQPITDTDWMHLALTWSKSAGANGEMRAYYNGTQTGATQTALGVWAGALNATVTSLGAGGTGPWNVWNGWVAHGAVWDRPVSADEVQQLYRARRS